VLADDSAIKFSVLANTKYRFRSRLFYTTATAADIKIQATGPAAPTFVSYTLIGHAPGSAIASGAVVGGITVTQGTSFGAALVLTENGAATDGSLQIDGVLHNGANAGTVAIQWAQNTSDAGGTIMRAGSYIEYSTV
jgi:hypothetical protein